MKKRVADVVVETLVEIGIQVCFGVVGGGAMHLNNAFKKNSNIAKIYNHHEQASAMAAEGYARATGRLAVVSVTSGPGGTNAINGVQGAWVDSVPMIVISGFPRVATSNKEQRLNIRCRGVQENDIIEQVKSITKYAKFIDDPYAVKSEIIKAVDIAMYGRRGPVWLDIPLDIQGCLIEEERLSKNEIETKEIPGEVEETIRSMLLQLEKAKRPCILTGSGIRTGNCVDKFRKFLHHMRVPIVGGSLQADICYEGQEYFYGLSGSTGPRCGNYILQNADFILVLGNSLSFKQTGFAQEKFAPNAYICMVDAEEDEARKDGLHVQKCLNLDLNVFFDIANALQKEPISCPAEWIAYCDMVKKKFPKFEALVRNGELDKCDRVPQLFWWKTMLEKSEDEAIFALGNSSCICGILQEGIVSEKQRVLVNYNCGSMGHDLPNAIGTAIGMGKKVICVTGDGSIMMNLQELQTIVHYRLPICVVVFSNDGYGAIRNTCKSFFDGEYAGCDEQSGVSFPSFEAIANAFRIPYFCCENVGMVDMGIDWINFQKNYCMLEVKQRIDEIPSLKLASIMNENGEFQSPALQELSPLLTAKESEGLMLEES